MKTNKSFIEFGEIDPSNIKSGSIADITWIDSHDPTVWANTISGIKIKGGEDFDNISFVMEPYRA